MPAPEPHAAFGRRFRAWRSRRGYPMPAVPLPWRWRLWYVERQYKIGVGIAKLICRGNRYDVHTDTPEHPFVSNPLGGLCLCSRTRRRLDYIPF